MPAMNGQPVIEVLPRVYRSIPAPQRALEELQAELYAEVRAKGRPVGQLVTALLDRRNLYAAWRFVRSADGADTPGAGWPDLQGPGTIGGFRGCFASLVRTD
jgi:hypothetical protein